MPHFEGVQHLRNSFGDTKDIDDCWKDRTNTSTPDEVEDGFVVIGDEITAEWVEQLLFLIHPSCKYLASDTHPGR